MKAVKVVKRIFIFIGSLLGVAIFILIMNYIRLTAHYFINPYNLKETYEVQGNKKNYVPQGLAYSNKYNIALQTSYNSKHNVSMVYITDLKKNKVIKKLKLKELDNTDNVNHVGGIATDNETVWIANDYEVNEYKLEDMLKTKKDYIQSIKNTHLTIRGDFCFYKDNTLWIGDFFLKPFYKVPNDTPLVMSYNTEKEIDYNTPEAIISLPKMVQGMVITEDNKFIFTHSFTNLIHCKMTLFDYVLEEKTDTYSLNGKEIPYYHFTEGNKLNSIDLPPMAEGFYQKGKKLYILFENSSDTYWFALPKMNKVMSMNIKKIDRN